MILHKQTIIYNQYGQHIIGDSLVHNDNLIKNDMKPRALDCLYLCHTPNMPSGHDSYHINTKKIITRSRFMKAQITPNIIHIIQSCKG